MEIAHHFVSECIALQHTNATCRRYMNKKWIQKTVCGYDDININKNAREVENIQSSIIKSTLWIG